MEPSVNSLAVLLGWGEEAGIQAGDQERGGIGPVGPSIYVKAQQPLRQNDGNNQDWLL